MHPCIWLGIDPVKLLDERTRNCILEQLHQLVKNCVKLCKMEKGDHFTQYEQKKDPHQFGQTCV